MSVSTNSFMRQLHRWGAIVISAPLIIVIATGIVLQVRKPVDAIQPNIRYGVAKHQPVASLTAILETVRALPEARVSGWSDIKALDLRPKQGTVKVRTYEEFEVQVDAKTAEVLRTGQRWNDKLVHFHEGSAWGMRLSIFLPAGIVALLLSVSGTYMLFQVSAAKLRTRKRRRQVMVASGASAIDKQRRRPFNLMAFCHKHHYVLACFVMVPWLVVIASGLLLQVRYEVSWVMPERLKGQSSVPTLEFTQALDKVRLISTSGVEDWNDVWRLYVYPNGGVISIRAKNRMQIQLDANTGELLGMSKRRTDLIENIHEGKILGANLWLFLPIHVLSLVLWLLGVIMWVKGLVPIKRKQVELMPHSR